MNHLLDVAKSLLANAGLDPALVNEHQLASALRRRIASSLKVDARAYVSVLTTDLGEQQAFLEALLVRESWFFRDGRPFSLVRAHGVKSATPLRVLSAPCANGEEPYSIAITLLEAGLPREAFKIDAIDLSLTGLELAKAGRYNARSLREVDPALLRKYFLACSDGTYQVTDTVKQCVAYRHANILDVAAVDRPQSYDIIFSRNVLIYMSKPAREQVLEGFSQLLTSDGLLFVGHAESGLLFNREFISAGDLGCFAFSKKPALLGSDHRGRLKSRSAIAGQTAASRTIEARSQAPTKRVRAPIDKAKLSLHRPEGSDATVQFSAATVLASAKQLADQGRYEEARPQVSAVLADVPDSAEAEHLMGLICAASGQLIDASRHFERSLYLQPNHRASVEHLSLVMDARGKVQVASRLRDKIARMDAAQ